MPTVVTRVKVLRQPVQTQTTVTEPEPSVLQQEHVRLRLQRRVTIIIRAAPILLPAIIQLVLLRETIAAIRQTAEEVTHREAAAAIRQEAEAVIPVAAAVAEVAAEVIPAAVAAAAVVTAAAAVAEEGKIHA